MTNYLIDIAEKSGVKSLVTMSYAKPDGEIVFIRATNEKTQPFAHFGGKNDVFYDHATERSAGTPIISYDTGDITNPLYNKPSSHFFPMPQNLPAMFFGNPMFIGGTALILGLAKVVTDLKNEDNKGYSYNYKVLPTMVIESAELDAELFGDQ